MVEALGVGLIVLGIALVIIIGTRSSAKRASPLKLKPDAPVSTEPVQPAPKTWPPDTLEDLIHMGDVARAMSVERADREAEIGRAQAEKDARREARRAYLWIVGFFARLATYAALFFALYTYAPNDISHTPLAALTLSDILGTAFFAIIALWLVRCLFDPSDDEEIKDAWAKLGFFYLAAGSIAYYYFATRNGARWH